MAVRPIDGNELYRIEKLLDTDIVRQDKVALNLLEQVLYDIQHVPTLTQPNEWVSVNKRLPEKRKEVLVHYGNGRIGIDWIDSTQCFVFDELYGRVTHWLPIPELPDRRPQEGEADGK